MTKESLAALLNGRDYRKEISREEAAQAKAKGLVVVFGASDDLMEFRGAIYDEIGAYDNTTALLYDAGKGYSVVPNDREYIREIENDDKMLAALTAQKVAHNLVRAQWAPKEPDCSWLISTELPHAAFDVLEGGKLYCRGLVLDVADLK